MTTQKLQDWKTIYEEAHQRAFSACVKMTPPEILQAMRRQISLLVASGASWSEARPQLQRLLDRSHPDSAGTLVID